MDYWTEEATYAQDRRLRLAAMVEGHKAEIRELRKLMREAAKREAECREMAAYHAEIAART